MVRFAGFSVASSRGDVTMVSFAGFSAASSRGDVTGHNGEFRGGILLLAVVVTSQW